MNDLKIEIKEELALLNYYHEKRELAYTDVVNWLLKRYNDAKIFEVVMIKSFDCFDALDMFNKVYNKIEFSEDMLLSRIAQEFFNEETDLRRTLAVTYDLLNDKGNSSHELSPILYSLVDDYDSETMEQYLKRAKNSNFLHLLKKYDTGQWKSLHERVFKKA